MHTYIVYNITNFICLRRSPIKGSGFSYGTPIFLKTPCVAVPYLIIYMKELWSTYVCIYSKLIAFVPLNFIMRKVVFCWQLFTLIVIGDNK